MKKLGIIAIFLFVGSLLEGAAINFNGHFRAESNYYNKAGLTDGSARTKNFILGRALLFPSVVIDDHFVIHSQWSFLTSPTFTPSGSAPLGVGQGGYVFGDRSTAALVLSRAWLEWTSDFGVLRVGRMPFSWGFGLLWDGGNDLWDDFQTTIDRLEYRLHLGHAVAGLAYSKE